MEYFIENEKLFLSTYLNFKFRDTYLKNNDSLYFYKNTCSEKLKISGISIKNKILFIAVDFKIQESCKVTSLNELCSLEKEKVIPKLKLLENCKVDYDYIAKEGIFFLGDNEFLIFSNKLMELIKEHISIEAKKENDILNNIYLYGEEKFSFFCLAILYFVLTKENIINKEYNVKIFDLIFKKKLF